MCFVAVTVTALAQRKNETKNPIVGSWKFSKQSKLNDFQKVFEDKQQRDYKTEYFTFESNHTFTHEFIDKDDKLIRTLKGKWKASGDKIKIVYSDVDYALSLDFFFIDKDLVLGQNFNHVIFTRGDTDYNMAMK
jgi:hypothetical protein